MIQTVHCPRPVFRNYGEMRDNSAEEGLLRHSEVSEGRTSSL